MPNISTLRQYLKKHPRYISRFVRDICKVWWWKMCGQPIVVLTAESGGLGDYFWFRSYYSAIREHYAPQKCGIIVIGMCQWNPIVYELDENPQLNHFDIFRFFESPDNPLKIELLFFKLFKADVYVDFRTRHLKHLVNAKECYFGEGSNASKQYYETANNSLINRWFSLPEHFLHKPPLLPIANDQRKEALETPFVVVVEKGNTQGKLSDEQIVSIIKQIQSQGYNIFYNGNYSYLLELLKREQLNYIQTKIIDGYTYPLREYPTVISLCQYVITVNTLPYHLAIQLEKPCVVLSVNEYETLKLDAPKQIVLFNKELQQAYESHNLDSYNRDSSLRLQDIESERIINSIDKIQSFL